VVRDERVEKVDNIPVRRVHVVCASFLPSLRSSLVQIAGRDFLEIPRGKNMS
jgi:hypothetical protein